MRCSNLFEHLQSIVIATLFLVVYAPNVLTRSDEIAKNLVNPSNFNPNNATFVKKVPYDEYYIEHNVSEGDAKRSFLETGITLLADEPSQPQPWCMPCNDQIMKYCLSGEMLKDHCCCDSRHGTEQIPWIPHTCYVGEPCEPSTGSCIKYTEIRECCCKRVLAKRWKSIYSNSMMTTVNVFIQLVCVSFLIISWTLN